MFGSNLVRYAAVAVVGLLAVVIAVGVWAGGGGGVAAPPATITPTPQASIVPPSPGPTSSQRPTSAPSAAVSANPLPPGGQLDAGTYLYPKGVFAPAAFTFTVPQGWSVTPDGWQVAKYPDSSRQLGFSSSLLSHIFADACAEDQALIQVGPTADDLADALIEQSGPIAEGPFDVSVGGYPAKRVDLTPPRSAPLESCRLPGELQIWLDRAANYYVLLGDARASVYIVDVDGARLVVVMDYRESSSPADVAELQAIIESIQIHP